MLKDQGHVVWTDTRVGVGRTRVALPNMKIVGESEHHSDHKRIQNDGLIVAVARNLTRLVTLSGET